ncbi:MAG TPA: carboxymuconolactone decarboxylase family protein [Bryobacteraceae bacterium]|nr:carboxymuconolactone decarboxylase family protein [Bryobacteraceae bacterium]
MQPRLEFDKIAPDAFRAMAALQSYVTNSGLEHELIALVKLRASQVNGCAYCIDMHTKDARANGESEQRLYSLSVWRDAPFYTDRERAALEWTEAVTLISNGQTADELYERVRQRFTEKELVTLTMGIIAINGWNRLCIPFRAVPGDYQPKPVHASAAQTTFQPSQTR